MEYLGGGLGVCRRGGWEYLGDGVWSVRRGLKYLRHESEVEKQPSAEQAITLLNPAGDYGLVIGNRVGW